MILVQYAKNQGLLTIELSINGTATWYYYYQEDQLHENSNAMNKPKIHTLGLPHELVKSIHNWEFKLANPTDSSLEVNVEIEWFQLQQGAKTLLAHWTKVVTVPAGGAAPSGESAFMTGV